MKKSKKVLLALLVLFLIIAIIGIIWIMKNRDDVSQTNPFSVVGNDDSDKTEEVAPNIIYQGLPSSFEINSSVRTLTMKNDIANIDSYYTGVKILEGESVIYDMDTALIEPGKSVDIDLYNLLSEGNHELTIVQYGYSFGDTVSQVSSQTSQTVSVKVEK